jgi:2-methylcitrate dehydratase PrpD
MRQHRVGAKDVEKLVAIMPDDRLHIVDNRSIPDICLQYLLAVTLLDGTLTFRSSHDEERMEDPRVLELRKRIEAVPSAELTAAKPSRQAIIRLSLRDGREVERRTYAVLGTPDNPMSDGEVCDKAVDLIAPVCGRGKTQELVETLMALDQVDSFRSIQTLFRPS